MAVFKIKTPHGWEPVPITGNIPVVWDDVAEKPFSTLGPKFSVESGVLNVDTPSITASTTDLEDGVSPLATGSLYLVYEE